VGLNLIFRAESDQESIEIDRSKAVRMGRSRRCDWVLSDPSVSRFHAEIRMEAERLVLHDLASTNGTFVSSVRTSEGIVNPGDRIRLGSVEFVVLWEKLRPSGPDGEKEQAPAECGGSGVLAGIAEHLTPIDLVQVLAANGKTGTLMLYEDRFGRIDLIEGRVCYAKVDAVEGEKAFHRILGWSGAEFQFRLGRPKQGNIDLPTDRLLIETVRLRDEMENLSELLPAPETELELQASRVPTGLSAVEEQVVRATAEVKTLTRVMDFCSFPDVEIARAVARLLEAGVLAPVSSSTTSLYTPRA
jgi:pSer/pThr/pTyr-binding forkhead associated (FHA) protein